MLTLWDIKQTLKTGICKDYPIKLADIIPSVLSRCWDFSTQWWRWKKVFEGEYDSLIVPKGKKKQNKKTRLSGMDLDGGRRAVHVVLQQPRYTPFTEQVKASCAALTVSHCCAVGWESHVSPSLVCSLSTPAQSYAVANHWDQVGLDVCIVCQLNCWERHVPTSVWLRSSRSNDYCCLRLTCCYLRHPEPPVLIFLSKQQKCNLQMLTLEVIAFLVKHYF